MIKSINELFREVILLNELDGNLKLAFQFSDPDGERTGKSGWSFGVCQFDTRNNDQALKCLAACGFAQDEIHGIVDQTIDVRPFSARLKAASNIIAQYDEAQLSRCIYSAMNFYAAHGLPVTDTGMILASADYVNQYGSQGEQFSAFMKGVNRPLVARDVLDFKLDHTKYGREHPKDCVRRYNNILHIMEGKEP
jgi:hypothetical protein